VTNDQLISPGHVGSGAACREAHLDLHSIVGWWQNGHCRVKTGAERGLQEQTRSSEHLISHQRLNMELDLQSLFELLCTAVLIGLRTRTTPPPHLVSYTRTLLVKICDISSLCNPLLSHTPPLKSRPASNIQA
jgi:hypothetical protein